MPLSAAPVLGPDKDVIKKIFQDEPLKKNNESPSVEIQKSTEIASFQTTGIEQLTSRNKVSREITTQSILNRQTTPKNLNIPTVAPNTLPPNGSGFNTLLYSVTNFGINLLKVRIQVVSLELIF